MMEQRRAALRVVGPALAAPRCRGQPQALPRSRAGTTPVASLIVAIWSSQMCACRWW